MGRLSWRDSPDKGAGLTLRIFSDYTYAGVHIDINPKIGIRTANPLDSALKLYNDGFIA